MTGFLGPCHYSVSSDAGVLAMFIFFLMKGIISIIAANSLHGAIHCCAESSAERKMLSLLQKSKVTHAGLFSVLGITFSLGKR